MKKQLKKAVAIVSALAMVVAGITVTPNYVGAETTGVEAPAEQLKEIGGDAAATWFYDEAKTTGIKEVVNIQKPGFAKESGVYVSVPAGISKVTVNGNDDAALTAIDGAGVVVYLTSLTKEYNTVVITYANGEGTVVIKNVNGTKETTTTTADVTQPDASSADVSQPDASSADVTSPDASSADVTSADVTSPDASSADVTSADVTSADTTSTDVTTAKPTVKPTTPKATTAKPTVKPTTAKPKATTKKASLKKTKITKKITKKLSSKKVKLTFKKVKGAKKYTVQVSTSKKFKKVLYKKTVKKTKVTLSSKKLKNKKKLYVRVKAVGAKKWSKPVAIKIKK